jgi:hypothetical protein
MREVVLDIKLQQNMNLKIVTIEAETALLNSKYVTKIVTECVLFDLSSQVTSSINIFAMNNRVLLLLCTSFHWLVEPYGLMVS